MPTMIKKEIAIVVPVKGQPGRRLGTLIRRVPDGMTLPEIIKEVRLDFGEEAEGVIFLDNDSFNQSVHDWQTKHTKPSQKPVEEQEAASAT